MIDYPDIDALLPSTVYGLDIDHYEAPLRDKPAREFYAVSITIERPLGRTEGLAVAGSTTRVRVTCTARTEAMARLMARAAVDALDAVVVNGQPLVLLNSRGLVEDSRDPTADRAVTFVDGSWAVYTVLEFEQNGVWGR